MIMGDVKKALKAGTLEELNAIFISSHRCEIISSVLEKSFFSEIKFGRENADNLGVRRGVSL